VSAGKPGGRILVVDDDDLVRELLVSSLQDAGFDASGAENGEQALGQVDRGTTFDAVVTDLSMPGMNGWDLVRALRSRRSDIPILMLTGYVDGLDDETNEPRPGRFALMQKPALPEQLAERLFRLMDPVAELRTEAE
jgi:CheY-like chemotaxis protein